MADFTLSKQDFANEMQDVARQLLQMANTLDSLNACYSVHGFQSGGANAFADADFAATNPHLSGAVVADTMFAIGTVASAITTGIRNSLRECLVGGLP